MLSIFVASAIVAHAEPAADRVELAARHRAHLGLAAMLAAPPLLVIGAGAHPNAPLLGDVVILGGVAGMVGGPLLLATGSLRSWRSLADRGAGISPRAGRAALGLWAGSMAMYATSFVLLGVGYGDPGAFYLLGASATWVGSGVFGVAQLAVNRHGALAVAIAPSWSGEPGFRVVGAW